MLRLAPPTVQVERKNGNLYLRSPQKLAPYARCVTEWLVQWSDKAPERTFLAERKGEGWRKLSYRETYGAVRRIAQGLLDLKLGPERPVAILSDNSIDHALLALGAMHVGIPAAPISPAYSLMSKDFGKLKYIFELLQPGLVFAADAAKFKPALEAAVMRALERDPNQRFRNAAEMADALERTQAGTGPTLPEAEHGGTRRALVGPERAGSFSGRASVGADPALVGA